MRVTRGDGGADECLLLNVPPVVAQSRGLLVNSSRSHQRFCCLQQWVCWERKGPPIAPTLFLPEAPKDQKQ